MLLLGKGTGPLGRSVRLMWIYEKRLQYPVKITKTCPKTAQLIISQYGGPDGELSASMRYLSQRYTMPVKAVGGLLTDIGTEELSHMEIICSMVYQLTKNLTVEEAKAGGFDAYYIDHTAGIWPQAASAMPFTAKEFQSKGDAVTDLTEDLAAEQRQPAADDSGSRGPGAFKIPAGQGDRTLPEIRRSPGEDERNAGQEEFLLFQSGV